MCSIIFLCKKYETDGDAYQTKETERRSNAPFSGGGGEGGRHRSFDRCFAQWVVYFKSRCCFQLWEVSTSTVKTQNFVPTGRPYGLASVPSSPATSSS